jgi:hypothetical protein
MKSLEEIFQSFETGIRAVKSEKAKAFLEKLGLDYATQRIGFNSGQFHHRETPEVKQHYENLGLLTKSKAPVRNDSMEAYTSFGSYGLVFPLFDSTGRIVNFYALRFKMASPVEQYLNTEGIYPNYPNQNTRRLFITPTVIDGASLIQSKALDHREAVMALQNGEFLSQHREAIMGLKDLEEIILIKR